MSDSAFNIDDKDVFALNFSASFLFTHFMKTILRASSCLDKFRKQKYFVFAESFSVERALID